ncbi:CBS domain-containing protein [Planctomycetota bacterium]
MKVNEIMTNNAETISSEDSVVTAAEKMCALEVGALPVWEGEELIGMVTDRDITVRSTAKNLSPSSTLVSQIMTPQVFYCFDDDDILDAAKIMEEKSVHRLLVLNSDYEPVGFVSLCDIAVKSHDEHLTYEIIEKISEPACPHR